MRHTGGGLAIPDFPTSYGRVVPPLTDEAIRAEIDEMPYEQTVGYFSAGQVAVHFAHRLWAVVVVAAAAVVMGLTARAVGPHPLTAGPIGALAGLLLAQVALGALVIWSGRHPEAATAHQTIGAATLATAALLTIRIHLLGEADRLGAPDPESARIGAQIA
jgi:heme A synthase